MEHDADVTLIDCGRTLTQNEAISINTTTLLKDYGNGSDTSKLPRGEVIRTMGACATKAVKALFDAGSVQAVVAAGGSGGTSLAAEVMRNAVPIGLPKLIVSTIASGETGNIIEETDITLMYSVVDVAGLNPLLRNILSNAGAAIAAMASAYTKHRSKGSLTAKKRRVGISMFGVTTPAVDVARKYLESKYDIETYIFHATGHGGKAMERLVREGELDAVLDITTTEICDHITGGVMSAGSRRLEASAAAGIPYVVSVGATDMTNFGPISTVPDRYKARTLHEHNPAVTLMRTNKEEAQQVGDYLAKKLSKHAKAHAMIAVWLPSGGISAIATPDGPFADAEADAAMFKSIRDGLEGSGIEVKVDARAINDEGFARDIAEALVTKMGISPIRE